MAAAWQRLSTQAAALLTLLVVLGIWVACKAQAHSRSGRAHQGTTQPSRDAVNSFARDLHRSHRELPVLNLPSLANFLDAVRTAPMGAVAINHAFRTGCHSDTAARMNKPRTLARSCAFGDLPFLNETREYSVNNGFFVPPPGCGSRGPPKVSKRRYANVRLGSFLGSAAAGGSHSHDAYTEFHIFEAHPQRAPQTDERDKCVGDFEGGTLEHALMYELVLGAPTTTLAPPLVALLRSGNRPIFSAMRRGASIAFHHHSPTWFALTHGRKAWWLGPAASAGALKAIANQPTSRRACEYLALQRHRPHPALTLFIQEAGEVLVFGEDVAHATCALEDSLGVGNQMGHSRVPFLTDAYPMAGQRAWACRPLPSVHAHQHPHDDQHQHHHTRGIVPNASGSAAGMVHKCTIGGTPLDASEVTRGFLRESETATRVKQDHPSTRLN